MTKKKVNDYLVVTKRNYRQVCRQVFEELALFVEEYFFQSLIFILEVKELLQNNKRQKCNLKETNSTSYVAATKSLQSRFDSARPHRHTIKE